MLRKYMFFLLLLVLLAVSGCGSSSKSNDLSTSKSASQSASTSVPSSKALTRHELLAKADRICARLIAQITPIHDTNIGRVAPRIVAYERAALAGLDKLVPPSSLAKDWTQIITQQHEITDGTTKLGELMRQNNISAARALFPTIGQIQHQMLVTAARAGFKECSHIA